MEDLAMEQLESQTDSLIKLCQQLRSENNQLMKKQAELMADKARLHEKNLSAHEKMEKLLNKLKDMAKNNE